MSRIKTSVIRGLRGIGATDWLPVHHREHVALADHLKNVFRNRKIDCVLDVGANSGQYAMMLRTLVGYDGWIFSFEPNPKVAAECRERMRNDPRWRLLPVALGREDGVLPLKVTRSSVFTSLLDRNEESEKLFGGAGEVIEIVDVPVRTLNAVIREIRSEQRFEGIYVKLDTQGFDLQILEGAGDALSFVAGLQTELSFRSIYEGMPSWDRVVAFLSERRFVVSSLFPVSLDPDLSLVEADGVFVRRM